MISKCFAVDKGIKKREKKKLAGFKAQWHNNDQI